MSAGSNVLRIGVAPWGTMNPKCMFKQDKRCRPGVELEILETLIKSLNTNVQVEFTFIDEKGCGLQKDNQTWTGLSGLLFKGDVDIVGNLCELFDDDRFKTFGFSFPVWQYPQGYLFKTPDPEYRFNPQAPFQYEVWQSVIIFLAVWFIFMSLRNIIVLRFNIKHSCIKCAGDLADFTFGFADPENGKLYWTFWICFVGYMLIIYDTYIKTALLYSYPIPRPFQNAREFAEKVLDGKNILLDYRNPAQKPPCIEDVCDMFVRAIQEGNFYYSANSSGQALVNLLAEDPKRVLAKSKVFLDTYMSEIDNREQFWLVEDESMSGRWSVFLWQKNFTYQDHFNQVLMAMGDYKTGIQSRYVKMFGPQPKRDQHIKPSVMSEEPLPIERLTGIFFVLIAGLGISFGYFVAELLKRQILIQ